MITKEQDRKITKAVKMLNDVLKEIQLDYPEAEWYLEDTSNFNLMSGPSHDMNGKAQHGNILEQYYLVDASGGAW